MKHEANEATAPAPGPFDHLYEASARDRIDPDYAPEADTFLNAGWVRVARFPKSDGDGQAADVYEYRAPARFFKVEALADVNSVGEPVAPFTISTGSGDDMGRLMFQIARATTEGMIGFKAPALQAEAEALRAVVRDLLPWAEEALRHEIDRLSRDNEHGQHDGEIDACVEIAEHARAALGEQK